MPEAGINTVFRAVPLRSLIFRYVPDLFRFKSLGGRVKRQSDDATVTSKTTRGPMTTRRTPHTHHEDVLVLNLQHNFVKNVVRDCHLSSKRREESLSALPLDANPHSYFCNGLQPKNG
jgi:hypothetical protein